MLQGLWNVVPHGFVAGGLGCAPLAVLRSPLADTLLLLVLIGVVCLLRVLRIRKLNRCFRAEAERWNGYCREGGFFRGTPAIWFREKQAHYTVEIAEVWGLPRTRVVGRWLNRRFQCEIRPSPRGRLPAWFWQLCPWLRSLRAERPRPANFDHSFVVRTNDRAVAAAFVNPQQKTRIERLAELPPDNDGDLRIVTDRGSLSVERAGFLDNVVALHRFVKFSLELFPVPDVWQPASDDEIVVLTESLVTFEHDAHCPICGEPIGPRAVRCAACRTAHHGDCWDYLGQCAIYGCGGERFVRSDRPQPSRS